MLNICLVLDNDGQVYFSQTGFQLNMCLPDVIYTCLPYVVGSTYVLSRTVKSISSKEVSNDNRLVDGQVLLLCS